MSYWNSLYTYPMEQNAVFVFDLDGVITNPADSSVDIVAVQHIYTLLAGGAYVAINTGRSYNWVKTNLLDNFRQLGGDAPFDHLYIVCEKGGESLIWNGNDFYPQPSRFALPTEAMELCKQVFDANAAQLGTMFWDATKRTLVTIEKFPEASLEQFHQQQALLAEQLNKAFVGQNIRVDCTTIAVDVELPAAGKHAGAELIYDWLAHQPGIQKTKQTACTCFGDSRSDYEMARYFASRGITTVFVFVGKKDVVFDEHDDVTLVKTRALYSAGTREYFSQRN